MSLKPSELGARTLAAPAVEPLRRPLAGQEAWVVGGTVRDVALGREPAEVDLAIPGDPGPVARMLGRKLNGAAFELSSEFPAWRIRGRDAGWQVDVSALRGGGRLEDDLALRDFTAGAIAVDLATGRVSDPTGGLADLERGILRACSPGSFSDDPLRLMRAARLAAAFRWELDPGTLRLARREAGSAGDPAGERILAELLLLIAGPDPLRGIAVMDEISLLDHILPEISALKGVEQGSNHHLDVYGHTLEVLAGVLRTEADPGIAAGDRGEEVAAYLAEPLADGVTRAAGLRLGALFHDCAKPQTRRRERDFTSFRGHDREGARLVLEILGTRLRSSRRLAGYVAGLTLNHLAVGFMIGEDPPDGRQMFTYLSRTDPDCVDVTLLTVSDRLAARGTSALASSRMVERHLELARDLIGRGLDWHRTGPPEPLVGGLELAGQLGIEPGPRLGELLRELAAARYAGEIATAAEAVELARRSLDSI